MNNTYIKPAPPTDFFTQDLLNKTYSYIATIRKPEQITFIRKAYRREINQSCEENVVPEGTVNMRRCFMYLTQSYEKTDY